MSADAISLKDLSKCFYTSEKDPGIIGTFRNFIKPRKTLHYAVEKFNLEIPRGSFVGLLGPNGAGKTTLMKMMSGIIVPSAGDCQVLGYRPFERQHAFRKKIALVMGQKGQLWWDIPALDSYQLLQKYYELDSNSFRKKLNSLAEVLGVKHKLKTHIRKLSLGERMKMELIACLLHEPEIIFLDEPTIGLDVVAQVNIRRFLAEYQQQHATTIILTSHYMADVEALCDHIVLIHSGKKRFDGSKEDFAGILGSEKFVTIDFSEAVSEHTELWADLHPEISADGKRLSLRIAQDSFRKTAQQILSDYPVVGLNTEKLPVEKVMSTVLTNPAILGGES